MKVLTIFSIILIQLCSGCYNGSYPTYNPTYSAYPKEFSCNECRYKLKTSFINDDDFSHCLACAYAGHAEAAYEVATTYSNEFRRFSGTSRYVKNNATAIEWYKTAANLGHKKALRSLFDSYYYGRLGPENKELALLYLEKAAKAKCEWAMLVLAKWSEDNVPEKAFRLYLEAASKDNKHAQTRLAEIYFEGKIVPQDICKSYFWVLLADAGSYPFLEKSHLLFYDHKFRISFSKNIKSIKARAERVLGSERVQLVQNSATRWQKGQIEPEFPIIQIEQTKEPTFVKINPPESMTISKSLTTGIPIEWISATIDLNSQLKKELNPAQVFDFLNPSVWAVISAATKENLKAMNNVSLGSAVVIRNNKLLTNWHVVEKMPYVLIKHGEQFVEANIYAGDKQTDRCILSVDNIDLKPVKAFRKYDSLIIGEAVYSIGSPQGLENTLGQGIISGKRELDESMIIQTTAQVSPGSSGGGLFDSYGNLIGITTFKVIDSEGLNFAIPVEDFTH